MNNFGNKYKNKAKSGGAAAGGNQKRFLINAAVLAAACVLLILRMPSWGVAQVVVLVILALIAVFNLVIYFKLK